MPSTADARIRPAEMRLGVREHRTVEGAIDRLAEAAQSVVAGQIEVTRLDVKVAGGRMLRSAMLLIAGALALGTSWTALTIEAYMLLAPELSPEQRLGLIAFAHGCLGLALLVAGARALKGHGSG